MRYLATILARGAGLALLLVPPARGAEEMATLPEELAVTESIVTQDEDELQTSLRAGHLRFRTSEARASWRSSSTASPTACRRSSRSRTASAIRRRRARCTGSKTWTHWLPAE